MELVSGSIAERARELVLIAIQKGRLNKGDEEMATAVKVMENEQHVIARTHVDSSAVECRCGISCVSMGAFARHVEAEIQKRPQVMEVPSRHPNSARFHELLKEVSGIHDAKQMDYGRGDDPFANVRASEEWGIPGWAGAMIRANDKVRRLQTFLKNGALKNEGVRDSLLDIACYAMIALVLYEEDSKK